VLDLGAAAAAEVGAQPATLALGRATGVGWSAKRELLVRNLSTRPLQVRISIERISEGAASVRFTARPAYVVLARGAGVRVRLRAQVLSVARGTEPATGAVVVTPAASGAVRVPWAITFDAPPTNLLGSVALSEQAFAPSDARPALLTFDAGAVSQLDRGGEHATQIAPLAMLDLILWTGDGHRIGLLARLRDLLPGRYQFGLTGRDPAGSALAPGSYQIRLVAYPTTRGPATRHVVRFRIK
jgi:hypothetical protein